MNSILILVSFHFASLRALFIKKKSRQASLLIQMFAFSGKRKSAALEQIRYRKVNSVVLHWILSNPDQYEPSRNRSLPSQLPGKPRRDIDQCVSSIPETDCWVMIRTGSMVVRRASGKLGRCRCSGYALMRSIYHTAYPYWSRRRSDRRAVKGCFLPLRSMSASRMLILAQSCHAERSQLGCRYVDLAAKRSNPISTRGQAWLSFSGQDLLFYSGITALTYAWDTRPTQLLPSCLCGGEEHWVWAIFFMSPRYPLPKSEIVDSDVDPTLLRRNVQSR